MRCRNEIASCEEAAYHSLPLKDAALLLFFPSQSDLLSFAQQVRSSVVVMSNTEPCPLSREGGR